MAGPREDSMNVLELPWCSGPEDTIEKEKKKSFIGLRNEAVRDNVDTKEFIVVQVRGLKSSASGQYRLAYSAGQSIGKYLRKLKLKRTAAYAAVYDLKNLSHGRCRMSYVPQSGAHILIGPPDISPQLRLQRSRVDAQRLAAGMGRKGKKGPAPKIVEVSLTYKDPK